MPPDAKISDILRQFIDEHRGQDVTIRRMTGYFGERAFGFLMLVFAMVCFFPIPIPGIHAITAIPLYYLSVQQIAGRHEIWFPARVENYKLPRAAFEQIGTRALPFIRSVEKLSRPRLEFMTRGGFFCIFGAVVLYVSLFLAVPFPMTNFVPSFAVGLMALGFLNRDGVPLLLGAALGIGWSLLIFAIGVSGFEFAVHHLSGYFHR